MKAFISTIIATVYTFSFSQSFSESDIKKLAQQINSELKGVEVVKGFVVRGCIAYGRTLAYQYDVTDDWIPTPNMKDELIANFKEGGFSENCYKNDINLDFYYYHGYSLRKKISIKSREFSNLYFKLGRYINIKDHPKSKSVNLKIKSPIVGWEIEEGDRPNIVYKFVYKTNYYMILIKENVMFFSKNEAKELLNDKAYVNELLIEISSLLRDVEIMSHKIVTVDTYPTLEYVMKGKKERMGKELNVIIKAWVLFYEDKFVNLQCMSFDAKEFKILEKLYDSITNSVIFPDQYN